MIKQPLFGQDSSPHITSMILSSIITLIAWIIFCLMTFLIKFKPKTPQYKEIQIVLSSTPIEERNEEQSSAETAAVPENTAAVPEPVEGPLVEAIETPEIPNPVEKPVAEAKVEAPKQTPAPAKPQTKTTPKTQTQPAKTTTKTETPSKTTDPSKKVNFDNLQYSTDYSGGVDFTQVSNNKKKTWDDSMFDNSPSEPEPQISQKVEKVSGESGMFGTAGNVTQNQSQTKRSNTETNVSNDKSNEDTDNRLAAIKGATGSVQNSGNSQSNLNQQFSSDLDIAWNGGTARKQNGKLSINLDNVSSYISEKKTTHNIEFTVDEKGYVILSTIIIDRESLLDKKVRDEIVAQIAKWRFTEASSRSTATFEYTILKQ